MGEIQQQPFQPSADTGEDRYAVGEARAVLLADAGRRAPDASAVRGDDETDRDVAAFGTLMTVRRWIANCAVRKFLIL